MIQIKEILEKIDYLQPFSKIAQKAISILYSDDFTINELSELIEKDVALTVNILKVVNSAAYIKTREITNLHSAINMLGKKTMVSIIMMSASEKYFSDKMEGYEFFQGEIWEHSLAVAVISLELSKYESGINKDTLYTAALLHDIGKIVLSQFVSDEYKKINDLVFNQNKDFISAEKKVLGFTHPIVGAAILKKWNFSPNIIEVAKFHQSPNLSDNPYVHLVSFADYISFLMGVSSQKDGLAYTGYNFVLKKYNIKNNELELIIAETSDKVKNLIDSLKK